MNKIKDQFQQRNVNTLTPTLIILSILMMKMSLAKYVGKATSVQEKKKKYCGKCQKMRKLGKMITCKMHYKQEQNEVSQTKGPLSCNMSWKELGVTFVE